MTTYETSIQLAARWGVTRGRIHQLITDGRLPAEKVGRDWLIPNLPERKEVVDFTLPRSIVVPSN